jgi:hypothetical protein
MIMKHSADTNNEPLFNWKDVLPSPFLPKGKIVIGQPVTVSFDISKLTISRPFQIFFSFRNQNGAGPDAGLTLYVPNKPIEEEVHLINFFKAGDRVRVRANLFYWINGAQPIVSETPFSEAYVVVE